MSKQSDLVNVSQGTLDVDGGTIKLDGNYPVGTSNVALGDAALDSLTSGGYSTALGHNALTAQTTGNGNVGVGFASGQSTTSGIANVSVGTQSLNSNTTADQNTAVGYQAGFSNTTGEMNTALGSYSLNSTTTGSYNAAIGKNALYYNTTGNYNVALGMQALLFNTTGIDNTAVGYQAGYSNTTGSYNTYLGDNAGADATNTRNTFVGHGSGEFVTTGEKNTILGRYNGNGGGLDIRTSSNNIVLSDGDGNPRASYRAAQSGWYFNNAGNNTARFINSDGAGTNAYGPFLQFSNSAPNNTSNYFLSAADNVTTRFRVYANGNVVNANNSYGAISDEKLKENIVDASSQWDDIKALTVRKYSMKADELDTPNMLGVIAQELEAADMSGLVFETPDTDPDTKEDLGTVTKQVNYSILYMKAVKALQEAMDRIETLEAKVTALEAN